MVDCQGGVKACGGEEHSELIVGGVAVASGGASAQLDDSVDGFCWPVAGSAGIEVGVECVLPLA